MEYSILKKYNKLFSEKKINVLLNNDLRKYNYGRASILELPLTAIDEINKTINFYFKKKTNQDLEKLAVCYNHLISIESKALSGAYFNYETRPDVKEMLLKDVEDYRLTLEFIKSLKSYDEILRDPETQEMVSSSFAVENVWRLKKAFENIRAQVDPLKLLKTDNMSPMRYVKAIVDMIDNKKLQICFHGFKFSDGFFEEYCKNLISNGDLDKLLEYLNVAADEIEEAQELFAQYRNSSLCINNKKVPLASFTPEMKQTLIEETHDNVIKALQLIADECSEGLINPENDSMVYVEDVISGGYKQKVAEKQTQTIIETARPKLIVDNLTVNERVEKHFANIVGLTAVKEEIIDMVNYCNKLKSIGKFNMGHSHMCFVGNPGTGKTTVARIVADVLYHEGFLENNIVREVGAVELRGEFVGQTAPKVTQIIKESEGGVLFLDESYQLIDSRENGDSFGRDALATLVKAMEDNKRLMVIFAGYEEETNRMIKTNQGLASRIGTKLRFENYTVEDLMRIATIVATENGYMLNDGAKNLLRSQIETSIKDKDFSNGRFVRNLVNRFERIQTRRAKINDFEINEEDVALALEKEKENLKVTTKKTLGFGSY